MANKPFTGKKKRKKRGCCSLVQKISNFLNRLYYHPFGHSFVSHADDHSVDIDKIQSKTVENILRLDNYWVERKSLLLHRVRARGGSKYWTRIRDDAALPSLVEEFLTKASTTCTLNMCLM